MLYRITDNGIEIEEFSDDIIACPNELMINGIVPYKIAGGELVQKTAEELETEAAEREAAQAEQIAQPTQLDIIEAQVMYTALMTDTLIEEV